MEKNRETPKAVVYGYGGYANCPNCDYEFESAQEPWGRKYCPECGQRIKWEWFDAINDNN